MRRSLTILATILALLVLIAGAILLNSYYRYSMALRLQGPNSINEAGYVRIGGIDQWIQIRGEDRGNPILLWLNGGPGFSTMGATLLVRSWERTFTVVMWDQRGEGKTFARSGKSIADTMTVDRMAADGIEVAAYLTHHLHQDKVIVLGHSWGALLGVRMVHQRPDLFAAYVGTGQLVNLRRGFELGYQMVLARARQLGNAGATAALEAIGPSPYNNNEQYLVALQWVNTLDPSPLDPSVYRSPAILWFLVRQASDRTFWAGAKFSQALLLDAMLNEEIAAQGTAFAVPVIIIQGADDMVTPTALARDFFDKIQAPEKRFIVMEGTGHQALMKSPVAFINELQQQLRSLGVMH